MNRTQSPNKERIVQLSSRLANLQTGIETGKAAKLNAVDTKLRELESFFENQKDQLGYNVNSITENVGTLYRMFTEEQNIKAAISEDKSREIQLLKSKLGQLLEKELLIRKDSEARLYTKIEEQVNNLRTDIFNEQKQCDSTLDSYKDFLENDLPQIKNSLMEQEAQRDELDTQVLNELYGTINGLNEGLLEERAAREQAEEKIVDMIKQSMQDIQFQITREKRERENEEERIADMIELTINKIHDSRKI